MLKLLRPAGLGLLKALGCAALLGTAALGIAASGGCSAVGAIASTIPPAPIAAAYPGLKGQSVGILVWAESGTAIDHPTIEPDVAKGLQEKLQEAADAKVDEVQKIDWARADDILSFEENHPEMEADSAEDLAPRLPMKITRLIYIEIVSLSLHPVESVDLSRGTVTADLKVVELSGGSAKVAYEEDGITAVYPPNTPEAGVAGISDAEVYQQSVDALTTQLAKRFITHDADTE
jgi:hypothetical protein